MICILLMGAVLIQSIHSANTSQFLEILELFDHHDLEDLDKKEKDIKEKFSQGGIFWKMNQIQSKDPNKADLVQLKYSVHFLDLKDNPPELG